jgi:NitT/TauT family transport system substrate-binding protein
MPPRAEPAAHQPPMILLSENFRALFYTPFYAAHAIGAYAAENVAVEFRASLDPARTAADLRAGQIDVMWGGPLRVLLAQAADPTADVVCFCDVVARDPFFVIGHESRPAFRPRELTGLRLGAVAEVPTPWLCLQDDIRRDGADPAAVVRLQGPSMAENAIALRAGRLDAVQVFQPHAEELLQAGFHLWHAAANRGLTAYTTLVTRRSLLIERRAEMAAVVRAMHRVLRWIAGTPGAEIARAVASFFPGVPAPLFAAAIDRYRALGLYATDPRTRPEGFLRLQAAMRSGGALDRDIPFNLIVDNSLAEDAIAVG